MRLPHLVGEIAIQAANTKNSYSHIEVSDWQALLKLVTSEEVKSLAGALGIKARKVGGSLRNYARILNGPKI